MHGRNFTSTKSVFYRLQQRVYTHYHFYNTTLTLLKKSHIDPERTAFQTPWRRMQLLLAPRHAIPKETEKSSHTSTL